MSDEQAEAPPFPEHIVLGPAVGEGATPEEVVETLKSVYDPEIGINIIDLGPVIIDQVQYVVGRLPGVENVNVDFVWTPTWDPRVHASEEAKAELGIW